MDEFHEDTGLKSIITSRLARGEFKKAWDDIINMARKTLTKKEGLDPRYENRDHLHRQSREHG